MNTNEFFMVLNVGAIIGTSIFGFLIGGLYGWRSGGGILELSIVGLGFTFVMATAAVVTNETPWERFAARGLLWLLLCGIVPLGRKIRLFIEEKRLERKLLNHEEGNSK